MGKIKKWIGVAAFAAIVVVFVAVVADAGTIRNGLNAIINWAASIFSLPAPNIF